MTMMYKIPASLKSASIHKNVHRIKASIFGDLRPTRSCKTPMKPPMANYWAAHG